MLLYHASSKDLPVGDQLRTPTGKSEMNVLSGGVVYLTNTPDGAKRYGTVYEIEVSEAMPYKDALKKVGRKKKGRYTRGVFVALPENTRIVRQLY